MGVVDVQALAQQVGQTEHMVDTSLAHDERHVDSVALDVSQTEAVVLVVDRPAVLDCEDSASVVGAA